MAEKSLRALCKFQHYNEEKYIITFDNNDIFLVQKERVIPAEKTKKGWNNGEIVMDINRITLARVYASFTDYFTVTKKQIYFPRSAIMNLESLL